MKVRPTKLKAKIGVPLATLLRRVQRVLPEGKQLNKLYGGDFYILDRRRGTVQTVDLEKFAREIGALQPWEGLSE